jgi:hypothetical protein
MFNADYRGRLPVKQAWRHNLLDTFHKRGNTPDGSLGGSGLGQ